MAHRSLSYYWSSYARVVRDFRNGAQLAWAHYHRRPVNRAVLWDGLEIRNSGERGGFVDTIVEIWGLHEYTGHGFYAPRDGDVVVDIGANIGLFSIWIARQAPGARILAFEPFTENFDAMRRNLSGWRHQVEVHHLAVGGAQGHRRMIDAGSRSLDHRLTDDGDGSGTGPEVEVVTLADALRLTGSAQVDLLKIDIEGAEREVFESSDSSVLSQIRRLALEYHDNIRPGTLQRIVDILSPTHTICHVSGDTYGVLQAVLR